MPTIHPSSIIDPQVTLADDVIIGPHCVLQGPITLGPKTRLISHVCIQGPIRIGQANTIYPFASLGMAPQDLKFNPNHDGSGTLIGDNNIFREGFTIHRATGPTPTTIGNNNYFMANSHIAHDCTIGNHVTLVNGALVAGHVHVHDRATLSGNAAVHQFCRIGKLAMLGGISVIVQDLPPFCTVYNSRFVSSLNLVGLRRAGFREHILPLKQAFEILYGRGLNNQHAGETILQELGTDPLCRELAEFVLTTKRGLTPWSRQTMNDPSME